MTMPTEMGSTAAEGLREILTRTVGSANIATYAELESPVPWKALVDAGWIEIADDTEDAPLTLRDLVEVALVWGEFCLQLPYTVTLIARRHSAVAAAHGAPVTFAVPTPQTTEGWGFIPFGQVSGVGLLDSVGSSEGSVSPLPETTAQSFSPTLRGAEGPCVSAFSPTAAREAVVVWAAESVGCARRLLADSVAYVTERHQFGKPIGSFQAVKHILADAHILTEQAHTSVLWAVEDDERSHELSLHAVELAIRVAEKAIQVHGGMGFTWEMGLHYYLRHLVALRDVVLGLGAGEAR
ncbi:acyl-CoA dehydrogenase family protein [Rhodococcus aetherivorans]|uniref:acyl-CoA dehydrogenase family protein n=1 Tax=Rhodococcus aetherivorans TaxID=191292 RepID=UPI003653335C